MFFVSHSMFSVTHNMSKRKTVPVHQLLGFSHGLILVHGKDRGWPVIAAPRWKPPTSLAGGDESNTERY